MCKSITWESALSHIISNMMSTMFEEKHTQTPTKLNKGRKLGTFPRGIAHSHIHESARIDQLSKSIVVTHNLEINVKLIWFCEFFFLLSFFIYSFILSFNVVHQYQCIFQLRFFFRFRLPFFNYILWRCSTRSFFFIGLCNKFMVKPILIYDKWMGRRYVVEAFVGFEILINIYPYFFS